VGAADVENCRGRRDNVVLSLQVEVTTSDSQHIKHLFNNLSSKMLSSRSRADANNPLLGSSPTRLG